MISDDLSRISSVQCGNAWAQTFSYDPFGNISKAGSSSYAATYGTPQAATKTNQVSGGFSPAPQYDSNGNQLNLTAAPASIGWNAWNVPISISGSSATYDALGRMVEKVSGGMATQFVYSPSGTNIASVSGGVLVKGTVQLPGGDTAIYSGTSGSPYIRHTDWLGSSRLATTWAHAVQSKVAYAPFGETYNEANPTNDRSFTGQDQNVVQGSTGTGVYDYLFRKYDPSAGRWLSPDPAGWGAVTPTNPQSLDRYAYVLNRPMDAIDPQGLDCAWQNDDGSVSVSEGDCPTTGAGANGYYIDCDGCIYNASNIYIDQATGDAFFVDSQGNAIPGTTIQGFTDATDQPTTTVTVVADSGNIYFTGYGVGDIGIGIPMVNKGFPNGIMYDPSALSPTPKLKGKEKWLCYQPDTTASYTESNEGAKDIADIAPGQGGAKSIPFQTINKQGHVVTLHAGTSEGGASAAEGGMSLLDYLLHVVACLTN